MSLLRVVEHRSDRASRRPAMPSNVARLVAALISFALGCIPPPSTTTFVVLDNDYSAESAFVVYQAFWQAVPFQNPIPPGSSSDPQSTVAASENTAYVVLAPGWDSTSESAPTMFVVLQSKQGFGVHVNDTLHIHVSDDAFAGNCAAGSVLTQSQADFITQIVFSSTFAGLAYDAATCTTTPIGDAGAR
jgi:hypothetical protein